MGASMRAPSKPRRPRSAPVRALTACVALGWLVAQLSSFAHLAFVQHTLCAEHGDFVHAGDSGADHADEQVVLGRTAHVTGSHGPSAEGDRHDHCDAGPGRQTTELGGPDHTTAPPNQAEEPKHSAPDATDVVVERARHRLAPKHGPPV